MPAAPLATSASTEKATRGKKPTAPGHVKVYKTAVFKVHNPTQHKRAMLADSLRRAHLAYTRLLAHLLPDVERLASMNKCASAPVIDPATLRSALAPHSLAQLPCVRLKPPQIQASVTDNLAIERGQNWTPIGGQD